jgi:hypothetical protein
MMPGTCNDQTANVYVIIKLYVFTFQIFARIKEGI